MTEGATGPEKADNGPGDRKWKPTGPEKTENGPGDIEKDQAGLGRSETQY